MIGSDGRWHGVNVHQCQFLEGYYAVARGEIRDLPELESIASPDEKVINQFLAERGFNIQLDPLDGPPAFGVASVFKLLLEWNRPGSVTAIRDEAYPAVRIKSAVDFYTSSAAEHPIAAITAKNGDVVYMTSFSLPESPRSKGFDMLTLVWHIKASLQEIRDFDAVVFPMIDYNEVVDISWAVNLKTEGVSGPWEISQALQQTKFRMNEIGAKVESAVAIGVRFMHCVGDVKPDLVIDRPFLLWIERKGLSHPLFVAHFCEPDWKKPEKL